MANPEQTKKLDNLFGTPSSSIIIPQTDSFIDLSKNPLFPVDNGKISTGLDASRKKTQEGETIQYIPLLETLRQIKATLNNLSIDDLITFLEFIDDDSLYDRIDKYIDLLDEQSLS